MSDKDVRTRMQDEEIKTRYLQARRWYNSSSSLAKQLAIMDIDEMERAGITEEDIDRIFPLSTIQVWLRDEFVDPGVS